MLDLEGDMTDCYIYSQRLLYGCQYKHQFPAEDSVVFSLYFPFFCVPVLMVNYPNLQGNFTAPYISCQKSSANCL